jgi:WD40 repeat protein
MTATSSVLRSWSAMACMLIAGFLSGCGSTPGREQPLGHPVTASFSPDGELIAISTHQREVALFEARPLWFKRLLSREGDRILKMEHRDIFRPLPLAFARDGTLLAAGGVGGSVVVWDVPSGAERFRVPAKGQVLDIGFMSDGQTLFTAGPDVAVLSAQSGERIGGFPLAAGVAATAAALSPDGHVLAVGLSNGQIATFDAGSRTQLRTVKAHEVPVSGLAFGKDRTMLASTAGGYDLRLWKLDSDGGLEQSIPPLVAAAIAESSISQTQGLGMLLWLLGSARGFQLAGAPTMGAPPVMPGAGTQFANAARRIPPYCGSRVAFSTNGRYLASTANLIRCETCGSGLVSYILFITDLETGKTVTATNRTGCMVAVAPDGTYVAAGAMWQMGAPDLVDSTTGERITELPRHNK